MPPSEHLYLIVSRRYVGTTTVVKVAHLIYASSGNAGDGDGDGNGNAFSLTTLQKQLR